MTPRSVRHLHGCSIHAVDGNLGHVDQFYFDDAGWRVRYLVVHTGSWLLGRKVLIAMPALGYIDWDDRHLSVGLTREQIENSPAIETHRPVSRRWEAELHRYYSWPTYWDSTLMAPEGYLEALPLPDLPEEPADEKDSHLQSTHDLIGYHIETDGADGDLNIGRLADFLLDPSDWTIHYLEIDTRDRATHRHFLLPSSAVDRLDWERSVAHTLLPADLLSAAPAFDPAMPLTTEAQTQLREYYGG